MCRSSAMDQWKPFEGEGLKVFKSILAKACAFSGVWIDTYSINAREFQIQVYVPECPELVDAEILRRYKELNSPPSAYMKGEIERVEKMFRERDEAGIERWASRQKSRMYDVSGFMKIVKERFVEWFNRSRGRGGSLFTGRFSSTMVEPSREWVSGSCAAIDSVQMIADRLEDGNRLLCTGLGDALNGSELARRGLMRALEGESWEAIAEEYQSLVAEYCEPEPPPPFEVEPLSEWIKNLPVIATGMEGGLVRIVEQLCGAVVWGGVKFVATARKEYLQHQRKMRARRKLGLVPVPGTRRKAAVLRATNCKRRESPG